MVAESNFTSQFSRSDHLSQLFVSNETPGSMKDLMYAVIATGGKQEKVETGQVLNVELLHADEGSEVTFSPILLVEDDAVMSTNDELAGASVTARVVGEIKGEKIVCNQTFKNLSVSFRYKVQAPIQLISPNLLFPILYFLEISTIDSLITP